MNQIPSLRGSGDGRPWGLWATIGFSLVIVAALIAIQGVIMLIFVVVAKFRDSQLGLLFFLEELATDGFFISIATIVSAPICSGLTVLLAKLKGSLSLREYFGFTKPRAKVLLKWLIFIAAFILISDTLTHFVGRPIVSPFMVDVYETAVFAPLLYVALIVMAPVFEEVLFRGFLFKGIQCSALGPVGAVVISALGWAMLHIQYDLHGIVTVFIIGLLLGIARVRTNSLFVTIAMHSLNNVVAAVETAIVAHLAG